MFSGLRHSSISCRNNQDGSIHLSCPCDHVLEGGGGRGVKKGGWKERKGGLEEEGEVERRKSGVWKRGLKERRWVGLGGS